MCVDKALKQGRVIMSLFLTENNEKNIIQIETTLDSISKKTHFREWSQAHFNLAHAYSSRQQGNYASNIDKAIFHFEQSLEFAQKNSSILWGGILFNIGYLYTKRINGDREDNTIQAINHCKTALEILTPENKPFDLSATHNVLGLSYRKLYTGDRSENLETSIYHYEQALRICNRESFPNEWAIIQNNLGNVYSERIKGDKDKNIKIAKYHFSQALEIHTRTSFPKEWANIHYNLGSLYSKRNENETAENLELAIEHFRKALEIQTPEVLPREYASTLFNLGNTYQARVLGDFALNIQESIKCYQNTLRVYKREEYPKDWAISQIYLASAYVNYPKGDISDNLEKALALLNEVIDFFDHETTPVELLSTANHFLGNVYSNRIIGNKLKNIELAIYYYKKALDARSFSSAPLDWAITHVGLGSAYLYRIEGNRSDNLEQSIVHFKNALEVYNREDFPRLWAVNQNGLGIAYRNRILGEVSDNIESSIKYYESAIEINPPVTLPRNWAVTQNNLGNAYFQRIKGDYAENLEKAIYHHTMSLEYCTKETLPREWSQIQNSLGNAFNERIFGSKADNVEEAIKYYHKALELRKHSDFPNEWAMTQSNLGNAYRNRLVGELQQNYVQAAFHYKNALVVYTRSEYPEDWARLQLNMGILHVSLDKKVEAISFLENALDVYKPYLFPHYAQTTASILGDCLYEDCNFLQARNTYSIVHKAIESMRSEIQRESTKRELAGKNAEVYERLVYCCLLEGDVLAALEYVFAAKSRVFLDQLVSTRLDLSATAANNSAFAIDIKRVYSLRHQIDRLLDLLINKKDDQNQQQQKETRAEVMEEILQLQKQEEELWNQLEQKYPLLTATQKAPTVSANDAMNLAKELDATIIEYYQHAQGWCAFVITAHDVKVCPLDKMNDDFSDTMLRWINDLDIPAGRGKLSYKNLQQLYLTLLAPLSLHDNVNQLILAPFGVLHLFPFAAALNADTNRYLSEDFSLSFAPSSAALCISKKQLEVLDLTISKKPRESLLSVAYPGVVDNDLYLPNVLPEAKAIAEYFPQVTALYESDATPQNVIANASGKQLIHFGCHGSFDIEHPQQSGLVLADGWLTVQRIVSELRLDETEIVTIGSCLSGKLNIASGDELMGLTQSMLTAGAKSVVGSLWAVDDLSTRTFFDVLYSRISAGNTTADAMHYAMKAIREKPNYKHPYYWAAFTVSGLTFISAQPTDIPN